ncbi:MAG TPA: hypothetical protein VJG90_03265, partial [Candidatus Nanoarchaeia archaeon]|nr:hypothetical protein [Candidatus Nanoarchaeia archaeon]
ERTRSTHCRYGIVPYRCIRRGFTPPNASYLSPFIYFSPLKSLLSESLIQQEILTRLLRRRVFGAKHIGIDTIVHGVPSHERGALRREVENLLRKGYIVWYNRSKGALQLNLARLQEIEEIAEWNP